MNLLLVEDDDNKRAQVLDFLRAVFPAVTVETAASLISALKAVKRTSYSLVLLDMTVPNYDLGDDDAGGGMHAFGGEEFLRQMRRFRITTPVIVVTQFETFGELPETKNLAELDAELRAEFPDLYCGSVYYHASIHDWVAELADAMTRAVPGLRPS